MSIWNRVLAGLVIVASLAFSYMAARALVIRSHWGKAVVAHEKALKAARDEKTTLLSGRENEPGIRSLHVNLHKLLVDRGRAWNSWIGNVSNAQTGAVTLSLDVPPGENKPAPHGIADKTLLYLFDDVPAEKAGRYLGQFKVVAVDEAKLGLEPTRKLTARELERLSQAGKKRWLVFDKMPADSSDLFAELKPEQVKAMIPESSAAEFLKDGKPAERGEPAERVVGGKYSRRLRDYDYLLNAASAQRTRLVDLVEATKRDKSYLEAAIADAKLQEEFCRKEIEGLKQELARFQKQREAIVAHQEHLEKKLAEVHQWIDQQIADNQAKAAEITRLEIEAIRRIDDRTKTMVQAAPAGAF